MFKIIVLLDLPLVYLPHSTYYLSTYCLNYIISLLFIECLENVSFAQ